MDRSICSEFATLILVFRERSSRHRPGYSHRDYEYPVAAAHVQNALQLLIANVFFKIDGKITEMRVFLCVEVEGSCATWSSTSVNKTGLRLSWNVYDVQKWTGSKKRANH